MTATAISPSASLKDEPVPPIKEGGVESLRRRPRGMRQLFAKLASAPPAVRPSPLGLARVVGRALVDIVRLRLRFNRTFDMPSDADADGEGVDVSREVGATTTGVAGASSGVSSGKAMNCGGIGESCIIASSASAVVAIALADVGDDTAPNAGGTLETAVEGRDE